MTPSLFDRASITKLLLKKMPGKSHSCTWFAADVFTDGFTSDHTLYKLYEVFLWMVNAIILPYSKLDMKRQFL